MTASSPRPARSFIQASADPGQDFDVVEAVSDDIGLEPADVAGKRLDDEDPGGGAGQRQAEGPDAAVNVGDDFPAPEAGRLRDGLQNERRIAPLT